MTRRSSARRTVALASVALAGLGIAIATAVSLIAVLFARTVVTPPKTRPEDVRIVRVDAHTITLSATLDSMTPGRYSLWFRRDAGHARVGEILSYTDETVTRQLLGIDFGELEGARRARMGGWYYLSPGDLEVEWRDVGIDTELGAAPAWLIPAREATDRWVIHVHGRAVRRQEALRAVPVFRELGYTSLVISYRNDGDAPETDDHRYALGDTEWHDLEAAMKWALDNGAKELVLMGWSMGGAIVLQAVTRSSLADSVTGVVLDSPVVDWIAALKFHAGLNRLPGLVQRSIFTLLTTSWAGALTGQAAPIDLGRLDFVARAAQLHVPILLMHSAADDYIPPTASRALAAVRSDIVTYEEFTTARHTKLWNYDSERYNRVISAWVSKLR
jgi:uncharacterized protein